MKLTVDYSHETGSIKPMNAVNNGPVYTRHADQNSGNLADYKAANIPFARTHDASFFAGYGGEHTIDVHMIFPDFDADPYAPESYDFQLTDEYLEAIELADTQVFYRLGSKIEHASKKYGTLPPKDFHKWAVICEHIIAHVNEGWADGHHMGIQYWEIWNEPDLDPDDSPNKRNWGGTKAQYFELYAITSKHLKARFPQLKIGGPAACYYHEDWLVPFFERIRDEKLTMDFYSWHCYANTVESVISNAHRHKALLDRFGLQNAESILNEWNYVRGWSGEEWTYSIDTMVGLKGAAFTAAVMAACQKEPVDMLMYYDARPCGMNGLFSMYNYRKLKGYYVIKAWGEMLKMGASCEVSCDVPDIYAAAARDEAGNSMMLISYYTDNDAAAPKSFTLEIKGAVGELRRVFLLDSTHDATEVETLCTSDGKCTLRLEANTAVIIK